MRNTASNEIQTKAFQIDAFERPKSYDSYIRKTVLQGRMIEIAMVFLCSGFVSSW